MPTSSKSYSLSSGYHTKSETRYGRVLQVFGSSIPILSSGSRVLDMGCAIAETTIELANIHRNSSVIGIDIEDYLLEGKETIRKAASGLVHTKGFDEPQRIASSGELSLPSGLLIADGFMAPFKNETFDAIYAMNNLYYAVDHILPQVLRNRLFKIKEIIRPHGYLLISGDSYSPTDSTEWEIKRYSEFVIFQNGIAQLMPIKLSVSPSNSRIPRILEAIGYSKQESMRLIRE